MVGHGPRAATGGAERPFDLGDRRRLGRGDAVLGALLLLRLRDLFGDRDDEEPIIAELLRGRLGGDEAGGGADLIQVGVLQLLLGVGLGPLGLGTVGDDLVEELGGAVLLARVGVGARHREGLAKGAAAFGGGNDHPRAGRALEHLLPLVLGEVRFRRHPSPLVAEVVLTEPT
jgi:hypothetical protein